MEHEEEGKVTIKMIPDLTNIPKWKDHGQNTMSKHINNFEMFLCQYYGVEGFLLDWVVRLNLAVISCGSIMTAPAQSKCRTPELFVLQETDYMCRNFTLHT